MKKIYLIFLSFSLLCSFSDNTPNKVNSPDKSLKLKVHYDDGKISYSVLKNNKSIINQSMLGIEADKFVFSDNLLFKGIEHRYHNENWTQVWGEQKVIANKYNEMILKVKVL